MNEEEGEKIITWRKIDNVNKSIYANNKKHKLSKVYTSKEKEFLNKYINISKNVLNEEKLYNIIIKFNFNEQLILSEIFYLLHEADEREKDENKINNIRTSKSTFVPYKTKFGNTKTIYSLKKENKPIEKVLSKEKKIYKYDNINLINNKNNEENMSDDVDMINKDELYPKRFSNFNKIIEDYKNKKNKDENNYNNYYNYYNKKKNKIYYKNKDKNFGVKYNNNNYNRIISHKYYNSKKWRNDNNDDTTEKHIKKQSSDTTNNKNETEEITHKKKQNIFIQEKTINLEYNNTNDNNSDKKNKITSFSISENFQLNFKGDTSHKEKKNDENINIISDNIIDDKKDENIIKKEDINNNEIINKKEENFILKDIILNNKNDVKFNNFFYMNNIDNIDINNNSNNQNNINKKWNHNIMNNYNNNNTINNYNNNNNIINNCNNSIMNNFNNNIMKNNNSLINNNYINEEKKEDNNNIMDKNYKNSNNFFNISTYSNYNNLNNHYIKMNMNNYYNYNPSNYIDNSQNNFYNKSYCCYINNIATNNNINNNIYNNKDFNSLNNIQYNNFNILLNQRIGVPLYFPLNMDNSNNNKIFYPYFLNSNNIMMSKYINMSKNTKNNFFINSFYFPQMIRMYYQGLSNINNSNKIQNIYNINKTLNRNNIMTPISPTMYYFLMKKIGINFIQSQSNKKTTR